MTPVHTGEDTATHRCFREEARLCRTAGRSWDLKLKTGRSPSSTGTAQASPSCSAGCTSAGGPALVAAVPVTYIAFDLLWQASRSLLRSPYAQRRALLDGLALAGERLSVPPAFPGQARALADASRELGLEGVVLSSVTRCLVVVQATPAGCDESPGWVTPDHPAGREA